MNAMIYYVFRNDYNDNNNNNVGISTFFETMAKRIECSTPIRPFHPGSILQSVPRVPLIIRAIALTRIEREVFIFVFTINISQALR